MVCLFVCLFLYGIYMYVVCIIETLHAHRTSWETGQQRVAGISWQNYEILNIINYRCIRDERMGSHSKEVVTIMFKLWLELG